jgi:hypothetical protein
MKIPEVEVEKRWRTIIVFTSAGVDILTTDAIKLPAADKREISEFHTRIVEAARDCRSIRALSQKLSKLYNNMGFPQKCLTKYMQKEACFGKRLTGEYFVHDNDSCKHRSRNPGVTTSVDDTTFRDATHNGIQEGAFPENTRGVAVPFIDDAQLQGMTISSNPSKVQSQDVATVEGRHHEAVNNDQPLKRDRIFKLPEAPSYRPTSEQFKDPVRYIESIREGAQEYGVAKIIPPDGWKMPFNIDEEVCVVHLHIVAATFLHFIRFTTCGERAS